MREKWKPIPGWEGYYSASTAGRIRRDAGSPRCRIDRVINPALTEFGYFTVSPVKAGHKQCPVMVHRLVLSTFIGPPPTDKHQGNHINGVKTDNRVENLEWATRSENISHAYREGLHKHYVGSAASAAKLTENEVSHILDLVSKRVYRRAIAKQFGISTKMISEIVSGAHWKHVPRPDLSGSRRGRDILNAADVVSIRARFKSGETKMALAQHYGVSVSTIQHVIDRRSWKHIR